MVLSKLQEIEAKAQKLELELGSCTSLLSDIPYASSYSDIPQKIADLQKQALTNLNKVGEVNSLLKELEVALEFADLSKQHAEGEATLAKERELKVLLGRSSDLNFCLLQSVKKEID